MPDHADTHRRQVCEQRHGTAAQPPSPSADVTPGEGLSRSIAAASGLGDPEPGARRRTGCPVEMQTLVGFGLREPADTSCERGATSVGWKGDCRLSSHPAERQRAAERLATITFELPTESSGARVPPRSSRPGLMRPRARCRQRSPPRLIVLGMAATFARVARSCRAPGSDTVLVEANDGLAEGGT